jgi:hypothetical protein
MIEDSYEEILVSAPIDLLFQKVIIERCVQSISPNSSVLTAESATPFHAYSIPDVTVPQYLDR